MHNYLWDFVRPSSSFVAVLVGGSVQMIQVPAPNIFFFCRWYPSPNPILLERSSVTRIGLAGCSAGRKSDISERRLYVEIPMICSQSKGGEKGGSGKWVGNKAMRSDCWRLQHFDLLAANRKRTTDRQTSEKSDQTLWKRLLLFWWQNIE